MGERESERVGDRERSIARQHRPIPGTALKDFVVSRLRPSVLAPTHYDFVPFFSFPLSISPHSLRLRHSSRFPLSISLHSLRLRHSSRFPLSISPLITTSPFFSFPPQHLPPLITTSCHSLIRRLSLTHSLSSKPQPNLRCR